MAFRLTKGDMNINTGHKNVFAKNTEFCRL
jgi:hypothetical protein